ncbi:MAG: DUF4388 domain-containing protein [Planctomycetota bacterium]|nr:DUF4388 domain-containing protein [Planctomycetota bacterium]
MAERTVALIVHQPGACGLLKTGDRWLVSGREVRADHGARLCGGGLCSVFPKLQDILKALPPGGALPDDCLLCDTAACDAVFRMEFVTEAARPEAEEGGFTRRLERGTAAATEVLKKAGPFLSRLPKDVAADLIGSCQTKRYLGGEIVLMQGVVGQHLFIVADGTVEVAKRGEGKDETVLVTLSRGDCFGEMSILTGEMTSAEVRSRGKSSILSVHKDELEALLLKRPVLSREFSKLLAERLKATNASLQSELSRGIIGKLSMISLVDLVQTLSQSRRTGALVLNYYGEQGRLGFRNGTLTAAKTAEALGDEAFFKMLTWPDADFCFEPTPPAEGDPGTVQSDTMGLLMEGLRRMDEAAARKAAGGAEPPKA